MNSDVDSMEMGMLTGHPTDGELAAFADGVLMGSDRSRVEAHLAECSACREDLRIATEAVQRMKSPSMRYWFTGAAATAVATAAAVALLLLGPGVLDDSRDAVFRGSGDAADATYSTTSLMVVSPGAGETVSVSSPRFVWRSAGLDTQYKFHIATAAGEPIATVTTSDTVVTSLDEARLTPGTEYYWWVDALRADRSTVESGLRRFAAVP